LNGRARFRRLAFSACSAVSVLHTRLRRRVASSFAVGFSTWGRRSRGFANQGEMPGFFALAAETPILRATWIRLFGGRSGRSLPAPIGWGSGRKRQCLGRVVSPRESVRQPPGCRTCVAEPGSRFPRSRFRTPRSRDPTRLPRIRFSARSWANLFAGHHDRGACAGLATFACPEHPCRAENDHRSRSGSVFFSFAGRRASYRLAAFPWSQRQDASNPFLQPTFTSRAPEGNIPFGDCPPSAVGNPPTFDFETAFQLGLSPFAFERRRTTLRSSDLQRLRA